MTRGGWGATDAADTAGEDGKGCGGKVGVNVPMNDAPWSLAGACEGDCLESGSSINLCGIYILSCGA